MSMADMQVAPAGRAGREPGGEGGTMELHIAHFSDPHIQADEERPLLGLNTEERFRAAVESLGSAGIELDAAVLTGDLTNSGHEGAYAKVQAALAWARERLVCPIYFTLGNHDDRRNFSRVFLSGRMPEDGERINEAVDIKGYRLLLLDSNGPLPGSPGSFTADQLAWLSGQLAAAAGKPTLIAFHHPPVASPLKFQGGFDPESLSAFEAILTGHTQVIGLLHGHLHIDLGSTFKGIGVNVCGGTGFGFQPLARDLLDFVDRSTFSLLTCGERGFAAATVDAGAAAKRLFKYDPGRDRPDLLKRAMGG